MNNQTPFLKYPGGDSLDWRWPPSMMIPHQYLGATPATRTGASSLLGLIAIGGLIWYLYKV